MRTPPPARLHEKNADPTGEAQSRELDNTDVKQRCEYNIYVIVVRVGWPVPGHPEIQAWMRTLDEKTTACVFAAIDALAEFVPVLQRRWPTR